MPRLMLNTARGRVQTTAFVLLTAPARAIGMATWTVRRRIETSGRDCSAGQGLDCQPPPADNQRVLISYGCPIRVTHFLLGARASVAMCDLNGAQEWVA